MRAYTKRRGSGENGHRLTDVGVLDYAATFNRQHTGGAEKLTMASDQAPEFHEPDQLNLTATLCGRSFDNAMCDDSEKHIVLKVDGRVVGKFNLSLVLALAADRIKEAEQRRAEFLAALRVGSEVWGDCPGSAGFTWRGKVTRRYEDGTLQVRAHMVPGYEDETKSYRVRPEQIAGPADGRFAHSMGV